MKFLRSLAVATLALMIIVTGVYAYQLLRTVPVTVEIIEGTRYLGIYSTEERTVNVQSWKVATFRRGSEPLVSTLWLENEGVEPLNINCRTVPEVLDWGSMTFEPASLSLTSGEFAMVTWTIAVDSDAPTGNTTFIIEIYEP